MTNIIIYPLCFILAFGLSLYFVPVMRRAALKWGVVDHPDGLLKKQAQPVPYLGGVAIYLAFLVTLSLVFDFSPEVLGLLLGGTIMLLIGLVDDFGVLLPYQKFAGQILATFVLVKAGICIKIEFLPFWASTILTFIWMIGIINAVNILDIMDGLVSGVASIISLAIFIVALINGNAVIATLTVALAGTLLGFLIYNFNPAGIYLGDAGSLFIGLMLGALAMIADYSGKNPFAYVAPILIFGVAIFEMVFVMVMRAKKGLSPFLGSSDHYAIRLRRLGLGIRQVAIISYFISAILSGLAIMIMFMSPFYSLIVLGVLIAAALGLMIWLNFLEG